ncbi:hypothetical protein LSTR_LSTR006877 [Laodelphax striatellus]|uniref:Uncharacterized protein n=1 Tax=Laodelphax striatellus TaxID=195883 RepID=A0A482XF19_LAOST|nr:hypothetical protein LSTR_LSTR006877 [Laodelphax striatellus]
MKHETSDTATEQNDNERRKRSDKSKPARVLTNAICTVSRLPVGGVEAAAAGSGGGGGGLMGGAVSHFFQSSSSALLSVAGGGAHHRTSCEQTRAKIRTVFEALRANPKVTVQRLDGILSSIPKVRHFQIYSGTFNSFNGEGLLR